MSYYSTWYLENPTIITDPAGFMAFLDGWRSDGHTALVNLIRWSVDDVVESDSLTKKIIKKVYTFYGFYPDDGICGNGTYDINHFSPGDIENMRFINNLSQFLEPFQFIVFGESWPAVGPTGDAYLVKANPSAGATAIPHELVEVK